MKTNKDIIKGINAWQNDCRFHPLTCGNDSRHAPLVAVEIDGKVILKCNDCDYTQAYIPLAVCGEKPKCNHTYIDGRCWHCGKGEPCCD